MQYSFSGSVLDERGNLVFKAVTGIMAVRQDGAFRSWDGRFAIESGETPSLFNGSLQINGKRGTAFGTAISFGTSTVEFQGSGPCPL